MLEITPFVRMGLIHLGVGRAEARAEMQSLTQEVFRPEAHGATEIDWWDKIGVSIRYSPVGLVEMIEVFPPANPVYFGLRLMTDDIEHTVSLLEAFGFDGAWATDRASSYDVPELGLSLYGPHGRVDSVAIWGRGYRGRV